jgi:hypothetical protein
MKKLAFYIPKDNKQERRLGTGKERLSVTKKQQAGEHSRYRLMKARKPNTLHSRTAYVKGLSGLTQSRSQNRLT